jgi:hypothetical protein
LIHFEPHSQAPFSLSQGLHSSESSEQPAHEEEEEEEQIIQFFKEERERMSNFLGSLEVDSLLSPSHETLAVKIRMNLDILVITQLNVIPLAVIHVL